MRGTRRHRSRRAGVASSEKGGDGAGTPDAAAACLQLLLGQLEPRRHAVDDAADAPAVRLAECRHPECSPEGVGESRRHCRSSESTCQLVLRGSGRKTSSRRRRLAKDREISESDADLRGERSAAPILRVLTPDGCELRERRAPAREALRTPALPRGRADGAVPFCMAASIAASIFRSATRKDGDGPVHRRRASAPARLPGEPSCPPALTSSFFALCASMD